MRRLTYERERRGWSRAELARKTGIHPSDIGKLEAGKAYLWLAWEKKLSELFGLSRQELLMEIEPDPGRDKKGTL